MPRLKGRLSTTAPARRASSAVPSVEPSSTTTTSKSGAAARVSWTTPEIDAASLNAGTTAALRMCAVSARESACSSRPAAALESGLEPARDRAQAPERSVPGSLGRPETGRRGIGVEPGVFRAQLPEHAAVRAPVLLALRRGMPAVLDGDGVDLPAAPAVRERVHPQLPVLVLLERGVEAARVLQDLAAGQRGEPDRVAGEEGGLLEGRGRELAPPVAEEAHTAVRVT